MTCDRVRHQIPQYICQALEGEDLAAVEAHLESCPECRREMEAFTQLDARLKKEVPALWEEIEPSPQFMAQLKRIKLDPQSEPKPGILDFLSGLWTHHRTALATGLSICLIIVVMIAINPSQDSDDDESTQIASNELTTSPQREIAGESVTVPEASEANEELYFSLKGTDTTQGSDELTISGSGFATPSATKPPTETVPMPTLTTEQTIALATKIALADEEIKQYLADQEYRSIGVVFTSTNTDDFTCNGPLVFIERADAAADKTFIWACVNMENGNVGDILLSPYPPQETTKPDL